MFDFHAEKLEKFLETWSHSWWRGDTPSHTFTPCAPFLHPEPLIRQSGAKPPWSWSTWFLDVQWKPQICPLFYNLETQRNKIFVLSLQKKSRVATTGGRGLGGGPKTATVHACCGCSADRSADLKYIGLYTRAVNW